MVLLDSLRSALADRYTIDRELARGGMAHHSRPTATSIARSRRIGLLCHWTTYCGFTTRVGCGTIVAIVPSCGTPSPIWPQ